MNRGKKKRQVKQLEKIPFQSLEIDRAIQKDSVYTNNGIKLINWDGGDDKLYLAEIKTRGIDFTGVLSKELKRQGVGLNKWENGELYLGNFKEDRMERHGFYQYSPEIINDSKISEFYWGFWKNGMKSGKGINLWIKEPQNIVPFSDYDNSDFDIFFGETEENKFKKGLYMQKIGDNYFVYYGEFDSNGKKKGNDCFFYNSNKDALMYGSMENDNFTSGYVSTYDDEGKLIDILELEMNEKMEIVNFSPSEDLSNIEETKEKMALFRNIMLDPDNDHFGNIFNAFKKNYTFVSSVNFSKFQSTEMYPKIYNFTTDYNDFKVLTTIEKHLFI